ncbi:uncharacterized protein M421DRAFT_352408 [Didymella exigua CBS 183.55]|uniref:Uncharacterized protein n=1 Tax=Didymella exigua CBS 183.55 TaxID=1150837 RepID=A0A6A5R3I5_9PLEO|nr:uncharacterized protein M421DRAFT_352408 [Didymella exigua CBS 183.55]KAF1922635.1 hypothetical protein M421DRAFT_352408 [Didymella exigua CBS 183.55]
MPEHPATSAPHTNTRRRRSPSFLQRLSNFDLSNNLLFNLERVYQSLGFSPVRTSASKEQGAKDRSIESEGHLLLSIEEEDQDEEEEIPIKEDSKISHLQSTNMVMSKVGGRPPKKALAKARPKGKLGVVTTKKRSPPAATKIERASKIQKAIPKANSGKRVNGRGASVTGAIVISGSEGEDRDLPRQFPMDTLTPPRQMLKIDSPGSEDDLKPMPMPTPIPTSTHSSRLENELVRVKVSHERELECLRLQLNAFEAKVKQIKQDAERQALDLQRRQSISSDGQMADREEELEIKKRRSSDLSWECDHLRREMEAARSCLKGEADLIQQRDEYERLYDEEQDTNADLTRGLEDKDQLSAHKAAEMSAEMQQLSQQIQDLQREVSDLRAESAALRITTNRTPPPRSDSPAPSPSPLQSTSASHAELRLADIRKTYITVKRRYDNLHSVASDISTATRSWDYSSFGEFGTYLRQLKTALDVNRPEEGVVSASQVAKVD